MTLLLNDLDAALADLEDECVALLDQAAAVGGRLVTSGIKTHNVSKWRGWAEWSRLVIRARWYGQTAKALLSSHVPFFCVAHEHQPDGWLPRPCIDCDWEKTDMQEQAALLAEEICVQLEGQ